MKLHGFISAFWLKLLMVALMLLDHLYFYRFWGQALLPAHYLARVVAPVFAYLMAQGMVYTRSRPRYIARLFGFAAVMFCGNGLLYALTGRWIPMNILFSLGIGAGLIYCIDRFKEAKSPLWVLCCIPLLLCIYYCEGQFLVPLTALIFYYLRKRPLAMHFVYVFSMGVPFLIGYFNTGVLLPQFYMIFAVIPILCYSGLQGPHGAGAKYFFYVFYPLHIWLLFALSSR